MTKIISVSMNKGGTGKTTVVTNLAAISAEEGNKVLIVDTDGQSNISLTYGLDQTALEASVYEVMLGEVSASEAIVNLAENLDILPSSALMDQIEFDVLLDRKKYPRPFQLLKNSLKPFIKDYDVIYIDCPPSIGLVTGNALALADSVIIPLQPELYAVQGLISMLSGIERVRETQNPDLEVGGIIANLVDSRTNLHNQFLAETKVFAEGEEIRLFDSHIPKSIAPSNSIAYESKPIVVTNKSHNVSKAFNALYGELKEADLV